LASQRRRLAAARAVVLSLLLVLVARLVQLQGLESTRYAEQGRTRRVDDTVLFAHRGDILDRNGVPLAIAQDARVVVANPKLIAEAYRKASTKNAKSAAQIAAELAPLLSMAPKDLEELLTRKKSEYVILAKGVDVPVAREIMARKLPGIATEVSTKRIYPNGPLASSVVGFVSADGSGGGGIEFAMQSLLGGTNGRRVVELAKGRVIASGDHSIVEPKPGVGVQLTIDRDLQWHAQRTLTEAVQRYAAVGGHAIVMDVKTGEILALASAPTFDPNSLTTADKQAMGNAAVSEVYEPGSVNKVITAAAAIETGLLGPDSHVNVPPFIQVADKRFEEHGGAKHLTFRGVLAKSSNVGTISIAQRLGKAKIYEFLTRFGLGSKTGVGLPAESAGILPSPDKWSGSQVGTIPIGQGVSATALQMAEVYAIVANGGVRVQPSIVKGTVNADGQLVPRAVAPPTRVIKETSAATLRGMLEAVTSDGGTAPTARIDGYRVGGKTGTARRPRDNGLGYEKDKFIASFIGFAPADKPELVVEIVLDRPSTGDYYAGTITTPAFRDLMSFALASRRVPPTGRPAATPVLTYDPK
jgi:cell division protein FtsI (penicillin-binding protein 3)